MPKKKSKAAAARAQATLVEIYECGGYMRVPDKDRREEEPRDYKKGYEIRLGADTLREAAAIRRLLRQVGLKGGKPFRKQKRWVQPVYGKDAMKCFNQWLKEYG